MAYVGFRDLLKRWIYTRQGLYKVLAQADFPPPAFTINGAHTKVWHVSDIARFESTHPELTSENAKARKVAGYALGNLKKAARQK